MRIPKQARGSEVVNKNDSEIVHPAPQTAPDGDGHALKMQPTNDRGTRRSERKRLIYFAGPPKMKFSPMIWFKDNQNDLRPASAGFVVFGAAFMGIFEVAEKR